MRQLLQAVETGMCIHGLPRRFVGAYSDDATMLQAIDFVSRRESVIDTQVQEQLLVESAIHGLAPGCTDLRTQLELTARSRLAPYLREFPPKPMRMLLVRLLAERPMSSVAQIVARIRKDADRFLPVTFSACPGAH